MTLKNISWFVILVLSAYNLLKAESDPQKDSLESKIKESADDSLKIRGFLDLARYYWQDDSAKTKENIQKALDLSKATGNEYLRSLTLSYYGWYFEETGQPELALKYYFQALETAQMIKNDKMISKHLNNLGVFFKNIGNLEKALEFYEKSYQIKIRSRDKSEVIGPLINLATILAAQHNIDESNLQLKEAESLACKFNKKEQLGFIYANLAANEHFRLNYDEAIRYFNDALKLMDTLKIENIKFDILINLAQIYLETGKIQNAKNILDTLAGKFENSTAKKTLGNYYNTYSMIFSRTGEYAKSLDYLLKTREIYSQTGNFFDNLNLYKNLADIYLKLGKSDSAISTMNYYVNLKDSINHQNIRAAIAEQRVLHELDKIEEENSDLKKLNRLNELEKKEAKYFNDLMVVIVAFLIVVIVLLFLFIRKIRLLNKELNEINSTKDKFFSIISHDLKNPISAFKSLTELLEREYGDFDESDRIEYLALMRESAGNLYNLMENLLVWSQSQRKKIVPQKIETQPGLIIKNVRDELANLAKNKNIELRADYSEDYRCITDPALVKVIIVNICTNSIKFTPPGGTVTLHQHSVDGGCVLEISDNGTGMDKEKKDSLFKIGKAKSSDGTNKEKGTGLGLIIVKEFTDLLGGKIEVESEVGRGTVFRVILN